MPFTLSSQAFGDRQKIYSVHVRTRKFRNLAKTKRYVVPALRANLKTQGGIRIDSDSICHRHHSVFRVFKRSEYNRPASGQRGRGAGTNGSMANCGRRAAVEGIGEEQTPHAEATPCPATPP